MTLKDGFKFGVGFYLGTTIIKSIDLSLGRILLKTEFYQWLKERSIIESESDNEEKNTANVIGFGHKY